MNLRSPWIALVALLLLGLSGCTTLFAKRAIDRFTEGLQEHDLTKLKESTSAEFDHKALRQADAASGLKILNLPTGKIEIVSVEELSNGSRKVTVKVGEKKHAKDLEYRLIKEKKSGQWVVDDIITRKDSGDGTMMERSVTEQMDLILTCRELLISWRGAETTSMLSFCDEDLRSQLNKLPADWLKRVAAESAGNGRQGTFKPDARLKGDRAFVVVPHPKGNLFLEMRRANDVWKLHDLAIEPSSKEDSGIRSLTKMVAALNESAQFLQAYQAEDRAGLEKTATKTFYKQCLSGANFSEIPLPVTTLLTDAYDARQFTDGTDRVKRIELLLHDGPQTYMLTLQEQESESAAVTGDLPRFHVDEVTLFKNNDKEVRRLSSLFLSQAVVHVYVSALRERNLSKLKEMSSADFQQRVWSRPEARNFAIMPDPQIPEGEPDILSTVFRGDTSEVTVNVGNTPMTIVMHLAGGWTVVDDVLMPAIDRPTSLKANLEALLTLHAFASAAHRGDLRDLRGQSDEALNSIAWRQLDETPELARQMVRPMLSEILSIRPGDLMTTVETSDGLTRAEIQLIREGQRYRVHDVILVSSTDERQHVELLSSMRQMIAAGRIGPQSKYRSGIIQASGTMPSSGDVQPAGAEPQRLPAQIQQATFQPLSPEMYSR